MKTLENWYEFRAYNTAVIYGYGTADEADRYTDLLNAHRTINHYAAYKKPADLVAELKLKDRDDVVALAIAIADAEDAA